MKTEQISADRIRVTVTSGEETKSFTLHEMLTDRDLEITQSKVEVLPQVKLLAYYSPSHEKLANLFLASLPPRVSPILNKVAQECPSGIYNEEGFCETTKNKLRMWIDACDRFGEEDFLIASDVDIQFTAPDTLDYLEEEFRKQPHGLMFQRESFRDKVDTDNACTGFFLFKPNPGNKKLFVQTLELMDKHPDLCDQRCLQWALSNLQYQFSLFDAQSIWSFRQPWKTGDPLDPPKEAKLHHAHWVLGVEHKQAQMKLVESKLSE